MAEKRKHFGLVKITICDRCGEEIEFSKDCWLCDKCFEIDTKEIHIEDYLGGQQIYVKNESPGLLG